MLKSAITFQILASYATLGLANLETNHSMILMLQAGVVGYKVWALTLRQMTALRYPCPYGYWTFDGDIDDQSEFLHPTTNIGATFSDEVPPLIGEGQSWSSMVVLMLAPSSMSQKLDVVMPFGSRLLPRLLGYSVLSRAIMEQVDTIGTSFSREEFLGLAFNTERLTGSKGGYNDGRWHHLAHVFGPGSGGQRLYLDGELVASGSKTGSDFHWQKRINIGFSNDASGHANFTGWDR